MLNLRNDVENINGTESIFKRKPHHSESHGGTFGLKVNMLSHILFIFPPK